LEKEDSLIGIKSRPDPDGKYLYLSIISLLTGRQKRCHYFEKVVNF
jgi:hypothetical protein